MTKAIYVDTMAIVKKIEGQSPLYERAYEKIVQRVNRGEWACYTSSFTFMEAVDTLKRHEFFLQEIKKGELVSSIQRRARVDMDLSKWRLRKIRQKIDLWRQKYEKIIVIKSIEWKSLYGAYDPLDLCLIISRYSAIQATDSIHVAWAILLGCEEILTGDEQLKKQINMEFGKKNSALHRNVVKFMRSTIGISPKTSPLIRARSFENL